MRAFVRLRETFKPDALRLLPIAHCPSPLALEIS